MKDQVQKLNDLWLRMLGNPAIGVASSLLFYQKEREIYHIPLGRDIVLSILISIIGWEVNRMVLIYYRKKFPDIQQTRKRIVYSIIGYMIGDMILFAILHVIYNITMVWNHHVTLIDYFTNILVAFTFTFIVAGIYEMIYYFKKWKETILESEQLKKENLQSQLDSLKSQVNPHFLFNSLNTLEALVEENHKRSADFVRQLASVYRFILQSNEKQLCTLEEELKCIESYFFLLQTRFGNGIHLSVEIEKELHSFKLPPLTLQMLVENAMKHNVVTAEKPLKIKIEGMENNRVGVRNNLQLKKQMVPSNKIGLTNIKKRYEILGKNGFEVFKTDEEFKVEVPLIIN